MGLTHRILLFERQQGTHYPIYHFFIKKTEHYDNYNKNGCKFAKRVNSERVLHTLQTCHPWHGQEISRAMYREISPL